MIHFFFYENDFSFFFFFPSPFGTSISLNGLLKDAKAGLYNEIGGEKSEKVGQLKGNERGGMMMRRGGWVLLFLSNAGGCLAFCTILGVETEMITCF